MYLYTFNAEDYLRLFQCSMVEDFVDCGGNTFWSGTTSGEIQNCSALISAQFPLNSQPENIGNETRTLPS